MHDGTISLDRTPCDLIVLLKIDNDDFGVGILGQLLAYTDIVIGFKGLASISDDEQLRFDIWVCIHKS